MYKQIVIIYLFTIAYGQNVSISTSTEATTPDDSLIQAIIANIEHIKQRQSAKTTTTENETTVSTTEAIKTNSETCFNDQRIGKCTKFEHCRNPDDSAGKIDPIVRDNKCPNDKFCCLLPDIISPPDLIPINKTGCGWINILSHPNLTSDETRFAEFPWIVAILENEVNNTKKPVYLGGGTLIHPNIVLTAAHIPNGKRLKIRAGEWNSVADDEPYPYQERDVEIEDVIVHKDYIRNNLYYDIALLFLSKPVTAAPHIGFACLPPRGIRPDAGTRCFTTGWGKSNFGSENLLSNNLRKLEVPVIDRRNCLSNLRQTRLGNVFELHSSFMCAGGESNMDICVMDGGSPLVCPIPDEEPGRYVQAGIGAWSVGCGNKTPGVFVDVSNLREWIDDKVKGRGYTTDNYSYTIG